MKRPDAQKLNVVKGEKGHCVEMPVVGRAKKRGGSEHASLFKFATSSSICQLQEPEGPTSGQHQDPKTMTAKVAYN